MARSGFAIIAARNLDIFELAMQTAMATRAICLAIREQKLQLRSAERNMLTTGRSNRFKFRWATFALFCGLFCACASAKEPLRNSCPSHDDGASDVRQLVKQNEYIGLYVAGVADEELPPVIDVRGGSHQVRMRKLGLVSTVKGLPPGAISLKAGPVPRFLPPYYFWLNEYHEDIADGEVAAVGLNLEWFNKEDTTCESLPILVPGYYYLVFSEEDAQINYEPILSTKYDPLYLELMRVVQKSDVDAIDPN